MQNAIRQNRNKLIPNQTKRQYDQNAKKKFLEILTLNRWSMANYTPNNLKLKYNYPYIQILTKDHGHTIKG